MLLLLDLESAKARIELGLRRIELDGRFHFRDGATHVFETGHGVGLEDECEGVLGIQGDRLLGELQGIGELPGHEAHPAGLQFRVDVIGHQVRGADVGGEGATFVLHFEHGIAALEIGLGQRRVGLHGELVLDNGFRPLVLGGVRFRAAEMLSGLASRVGARNLQNQRAGDDRKTDHG